MSQLNRGEAVPVRPWPRLRMAESAGFLLQVAAPALLLAAWEASVRAGLVRPTILPAPSTIALTFAEMVRTGELFGHLSISLLRVLQGFLLGAFWAIVLGTLIGLSPLVSRALTLLLGVLRPIPVVAWVPLLILWLGIGEGSKVTLIGIGTFWPVLLNLIHGIRTVDRKLLEVASVFRKGPVALLRRVIFPAALPSLVTGLRLGLGMAWMSVIAAELLGAHRGIGFLIAYARELTQVDLMFTGLVSIGITGILIDTGIRWLERRLVRWNVDIREGR